MTALLEPVVSSPGSAPHASSRLQRWMPRGVLGMTMVFTGAAGLIYEYVLSTVFSYLLGNSIEQFSLTIGIMFAMMGLGGILQKFLRGSLVELFLAAELLLVMLGGFAPIVLQWAFAELPNDFMAIKYFYICAIGFLVGIEIPLVMRINERFTTSLGNNIAGTWAWDYIGGFLGVIAWIAMLRAFVPITHISFWVAGCNLIVALISLAFFWHRGLLRKPGTAPLALLTSLGVVLALILGYARVDGWSAHITQRLYEDPIETVVTTKYQNIVLTKGIHPTDPAGEDWRLWLNGNKQFSSADEKIYHELLVHPAMNLAARHERVLILGGGDGLALREVLKYPGVKEATLVDLDPGMIELARTHPVLRTLNQDAFADARVSSSLDSPALNEGVVDTGTIRNVSLQTGETREVDCEMETATGTCREPLTQSVADVNVFTIDADRFLSERGGPWDVVIVDLPDPNSVELAKLYSQEFYTKIKRSLAPDGMVVVQSTSPYHAKETFLCIMRTMGAAGLGTTPYHENVPSFGDWGWILGSPSLSPDSLSERAGSLEEFGVPTDEIDAAGLKRALIFNRGWLNANRQEVSTLMQPVVFELYIHEAWRTD